MTSVLDQYLRWLALVTFTETPIGCAGADPWKTGADFRLEIALPEFARYVAESRSLDLITVTL